MQKTSKETNKKTNKVTGKETGKKKKTGKNNQATTTEPTTPALADATWKPKSKALGVVIDLLNLEQIEVNLFRGQSEDLAAGNVFGGQVLGQALRAAYHTVPDGRIAHSMHCYFLRPGDIKAPIVYDVDRIRDGKSFITRRVRAIQHGEVIFNMSASFQVMEEGLEHQIDMPDVPGPEELTTELEDRQEIEDRIPEKLRPRFLRERPIEMRSVSPMDFFDPTKREPYKHMWLRAPEALPDDLRLHQALLAYASDMGLLGTSLLPHGISFATRNFQGASLDHAMWFHRPFRFDQWLLYTTDSPMASNARGFNRGSVFTRDGVLVASAAQEGLMRIRKD